MIDLPQIERVAVRDCARIIETAHLRVAPGDKIIDVLAVGERVEIVNTVRHEKLWYSVITTTGRRGWVIAAAVKVDASPAIGGNPIPLRPAAPAETPFGDDVDPGARDAPAPSGSWTPDREFTPPPWWDGWIIIGAVILVITILLWTLGAFAHAGKRDLILPDPTLTPGVTRDLSLEEICMTKWGRDARAVTAAMKRAVFRAYGLTGNTDRACVRDAHGRRCEVDHLISRELGGADDVKNLWPEPFGTQPWNATRKDRLENRLHKEVCAGALSLADAQHALTSDWRRAYVGYFGAPK